MSEKNKNGWKWNIRYAFVFWPSVIFMIILFTLSMVKFITGGAV